MKKLVQFNRNKVIDFLTERLTFERSAFKLYDTILEKMRRLADPEMDRLAGPLKEHREQEKVHVEWLQAQIRKLGGDAHGTTELSALATREALGIEEVIAKDAEIPHLLHALLAAELVDNAGWDLLVELADEAGDREARKSFRRYLEEEERHLAFVRKAIAEYAKSEVLGQPADLP